MNPAPQFTARQIADALGVTRGQVHHALRAIAPDGKLAINGNDAKTWLPSSLPSAMLATLNKIARPHFRRDAAHLLSDPVPPELLRDFSPPNLNPNLNPVPSEEGSFPQTRLALERIRESNTPAAAMELVWLNACEETASAIRAGEALKTVKAAMLAILWRAIPALAATRAGLRMKFQRVFDRWQSSRHSAAAFKDRRIEANKNRRIELSKDDGEKLIAHATLNCGGRLSQAWRDARHADDLSPDLAARYVHNPASKSYVPATVRRALGHKVKMLWRNHHGPRQTRDSGAWISRDWSKVPSMAWFNMDDATLPLYFAVPDGHGWFTLTRGQFIVAIDLRSTCILGYALIPERSYNARAIRTVITKVFDDHGLPTRGFYFEQGMWKTAKLLVGKKQDDCAASNDEIETGLRGFGLEIRHAIRARSKPVERVIGALQNLMEGDPGYVGRNEQVEKFEAVQRHKLDVDARRVHPSEHFYSHQQWDARLAEICASYNADAQDGKMSGGFSPDDALEKFRDRADRPVVPDERWRYLLAHSRHRVKVGTNGITLRFGKEGYNYKNERTGELRGQTVIAWFNPECPDILAVTDLNRENPFCIQRAGLLDAMDATPEDSAREQSRVVAHMGYAKTLYRTIKSRYPQKPRVNVVSPATVQLGREMEESRQVEADKLNEQKRNRASYKRAGLALPAGRITPEQSESASRLAEFLDKHQTA